MFTLPIKILDLSRFSAVVQRKPKTLNINDRGRELIDITLRVKLPSVFGSLIKGDAFTLMVMGMAD
jgi:hypothetical protein